MGQLTLFQPNPGPARPCPICGTPRPHSPRYPDQVCAACVERAVDEDGRRLTFFNTSLLGGFGAGYAESGEQLEPPRDEQVCFIDGVRCVAREARFGGIVVQPVPGASRNADATTSSSAVVMEDPEASCT